MGAENSLGISNLNSEVLSKSFGLEEKFRKGGVIGEKSDQNERDIANEKVREILNTSFQVRMADGQFHNAEYTSVKHMIEISKGGGWTDDTKDRAKQALYEVGLALSQSKAVFKAATEGVEELSKILPSNLHEIQPYILSSYLTNGKSDEDGQKIVGEMVDLFKLKRRADERPDYYRSDFEEKAKGLFTKLLDKCDDASSEDEDNGNVGRWETMMGYIKGIDDRTNRTPAVSVRGVEDEYTPPVQIADQFDGGKDDKDGRGMESRPWELEPDAMADAMLDMDYQMNFNSRTPPYWFKNLKPETLGFANTKTEKERIQAKIILMSMVNDAASWLKSAGKDLDKIIGSRSAFSFTHEYMNTLFDADFKLVMSKMINDLCEFYTDQNGNQCLRYKEKFYKLLRKNENGVPILEDGEEVDKSGQFVVDKKTGKRKTIDDNEFNRKNKIGIRTIDEDVFGYLDGRETYLKNLAIFLAKTRGREKPNYLDRMNANSAWNLWFSEGNSSVADRMRILPTWEGIMCDAIRTLNPEYKALAKWQILKGGKIREDENLFDAEYFSGPIADYVISVMRIERDLGRPIDGKKTLREKIVDGDVRIFPDKTFYGFFDFCNGPRDLNLPKGSSVSLGQLVMDYAKFDGNGDLIKGSEKDFSFKPGQTTFMNEFRDSLEAAILAYKAIMGKTEAKSVKDLSLMIKDKFGMANGIEFGDGSKPFTYTASPDFWAKAIQAIVGPNFKWMSSDFIPIKKPELKNGAVLSYDLYVSQLVRDLLNVDTLNINVENVVKLLGVSEYKNGKTAESASLFRLLGNQISNETSGINKTRALRDERDKKIARLGTNEDLLKYKSDFAELVGKSTESDYRDMLASLKRTLEMGNVKASEKLVRQLREFLNSRN